MVLRSWLVLLVVAACALAACSGSEGGDVAAQREAEHLERVQGLRQKVGALGLRPVVLPSQPNDDLVQLGHNLFFDPILSGSKDINCAVCHAMDQATANAVPLSVGTGARMVEGVRRPGPALAFTSRNSPALFNLGQPEVSSMFWDKRLERIEDGRMVLYERSFTEQPETYLRVLSPELDNILAAQNMLPVFARNEMRGIHGSKDIFGEPNELALVPDHDFEGNWRLLAKRLQAVPAYQELFAKAYPGVAPEDINFVHAANAMSAFIQVKFTLDDSPWDRFLKGEDGALGPAEVRGALVFHGKGECATCHSGKMMTDEGYHNIGVVPMTRGPEPLEYMDLGVAHRSLAGPEDCFAFRTPPLRNVALTGPYMHNGSYDTLEAVIRHKMDARHALYNFDPSHLEPRFQEQVHRRPENLARVEATLSSHVQEPLELSDGDVADLVAFLNALTSPRAQDLMHLNLEEVPSGLPVPSREDEVPRGELSSP